MTVQTLWGDLGFDLGTEASRAPSATLGVIRGYHSPWCRHTKMPSRGEFSRTFLESFSPASTKQLIAFHFRLKYFTKCGQLFKSVIYSISGQQVIRVSAPPRTLGYIIENGCIKAMEYSTSWNSMWQSPVNDRECLRLSGDQAK